MASRVLMGQFIQKTTEYLQNTVSRKDLQLLLAKEEAWKVLVAEAELSRDEETSLYRALKRLPELPTLEDKDSLQKELQDRKRFLEAFPKLKRKLQKNIRKLRALADHLDQVHRNCTISNVVTASTSAGSGVLGILGLALAPITAGGSLLLSATGLGLGIVATVTGTTSAIVERTSRWSDEAEAKRLMSDTLDILNTVLVLGQNGLKLDKTISNVIKQLKFLGKHIRAIRVVRANRLMTSGRTPAARARRVQNTFEGTALAMTPSARIMGAVTAGAFLAMDVDSILKDARHLCNGAKSESGEDLRALAQELEEMLKKISQIHKTLLSDNQLREHGGWWR
ncbi:apolipoprotein L3-like [Apodemus sylvaticus]|uniref:apolipoprotein L3-like n=1 Tax=Apodemus sylvaticus TaxID=10129 RepID=UPI002242F90F|nr:apolipoprotein L3-like [Apodemus sylvaticus]